ncbi:hypothetical protein [Winogradskyella sp. R77965]|uniref:hypothetical protein n=1 Tax=Winogradskyella sp. R77965 TaxID=3093872 RepID=UPI0037DC603B
MKKIATAIALIVILPITMFCKKKETTLKTENYKSKEYTPTKLPSDTTLLWVNDSFKEKDTVLIVGEGGPKNSLDFENNGRVYWEYLNNYDNYQTIVIHQSSTYNKTIFNALDFKISDGYKEAENSAEIMYRAIKYFKDRNKYVIVAGHSYSAFIIPYYIANRPSLADTYLMTGGRLNADSIQTQYQLKGSNSGFKKDGNTLIIPDTTLPPKRFRTERFFRIIQVKEMLKAGVGNFKFTDELADKDLSNLIFCYGKKDSNVGIPTQEELDFLKTKGAKIVATDADHYNIWKRVIDSLRDGTIKL